MFTVTHLQVNSAVSTAIHEQVLKEVATRRDAMVSGNVVGFEKVPVPGDGLCCYHCILAQLKYPEWSQIARKASGYAVNSRRVQKEGENAMELRQLALDSTAVFNDDRLSYFAGIASEHLYVDIVELSWLGRVLDLAIRCTMQSEARCFFCTNNAVQYCTTFTVKS